MDRSCRILCAGCGAEAPRNAPFPFRCPHARGADDVDHVMVRRLRGMRFPARTARPPDSNPFLRYRSLLSAWHLARDGGIGDERFLDLVRDVDDRVARVDGRRFRATPFAPSRELALDLGLTREDAVWIKDETGNVAGSHKSRHLMGVALRLAVARELGIAPALPGGEVPLAIASCGNAALAAAVIARAIGRTLLAFVPPDADAAVLARLTELGALLRECKRRPGEAGDPCFLRFREAVADGAVPFTCQGTENGLCVEGGETLAWEMVEELDRANLMPDRMFVQVGGGALAAACAHGWREARELGADGELPRFHAVQTDAVAPLARAWTRVAERIERRTGRDTAQASAAERATWIREHAPKSDVEAELAYAAAHRSEFMRPWTPVGRSAATGILDDETYDWHAIVRAMLESGGWPVVVSEDEVLGANARALETTRICVGPTGSAGLAGLIHLIEAGEMRRDETAIVIFTGVS